MKDETGTHVFVPRTKKRCLLERRLMPFCQVVHNKMKTYALLYLFFTPRTVFRNSPKGTLRMEAKSPMNYISANRFGRCRTARKLRVCHSLGDIRRNFV